MIRIAVCDDNPVMLENIVKIAGSSFGKYTSDYEITSCLDGNSLLNEHSSAPFDVVFLDIDMPGVTGFDVAKKMRESFSDSFIIFITSHSELVYESMDFQPFNFIRKDCGIALEESVESIIKKLMRHIKQNEKIILEDALSGRKAVYIRDVLYLESDKHYVKYYIKGLPEPIRIRGSINECEELYSEYDFIRIHKQLLINLRFLARLDKSNNEILVGEINRRLAMSKNYKKSVDEKYTLYLRSKI